MQRIFGVDIGGTNIKLGIVDRSGSILESGSISTNAGEAPESTVERIAGWCEEHSGGSGGVLAAGIACAGLVDGERGILHYSPNLPGWNGAPLSGMFGERLGVPVTVDNDVNCAAWGEYLMGAGRGTACFVCITLGTGVGGGVVIGGKLFRGSQGLAGEVGHHVIMAGGPVCTCGNSGCLEALVGSPAILKRAAGFLDRAPESTLAGRAGITVKDIAAAAEAGDEAAAGILAETGRYLGIGLANIVHMFNPDVIAVGGGVAGAGDYIMEPARKTMIEHMMSDILASVTVTAAELGNRASFLGAAMMSLGKI